LAPLVDINNTKTAYNASGDVSNSIDCDGGTKDWLRRRWCYHSSRNRRKSFTAKKSDVGWTHPV